MKLSDLLNDYEPYHSAFQLERLVLVRNGQTLYGCYKQVLRELTTRIPAVIEACNSAISRINSGAQSVPYTQTPCQAVQIFLFRDQIREFCILYNYAISFKKQLGELTPSRKSELEFEYWITHTKSSIARDLIADGRLSSATLELIHSLPIHMRSQVLPYITQPSQQDVIVDWYLQYQLELPLPAGNCWQTLNQIMDEWFGIYERDRLRIVLGLAVEDRGLEEQPVPDQQGTGIH
jgi:hypothetical protein